jgi:hypothetical protein
MWEQGLAALAYGATSLCIMFFNKIVLSVYGFPSFTFLALAQFVITATTLAALRAAGVVQYVAGRDPRRACPRAHGPGRDCGMARFPRFSRQIIGDVFPLPLLFLLNTVRRPRLPCTCVSRG